MIEINFNVYVININLFFQFSFCVNADALVFVLSSAHFDMTGENGWSRASGSIILFDIFAEAAASGFTNALYSWRTSRWTWPSDAAWQIHFYQSQLQWIVSWDFAACFRVLIIAKCQVELIDWQERTSCWLLHSRWGDPHEIHRAGQGSFGPWKADEAVAPWLRNNGQIESIHPENTSSWKQDWTHHFQLQSWG